MSNYQKIGDVVLITPVTNSPFFVSNLFNEKFADHAPEYGEGVVCFYRLNWKRFIPLCYTNFLTYEEVILVGGAMTDGSVFRLMPKSTRDTLKRSGGVYYQVLLFAFEAFKDEGEAFFGYAGDKRAYEIDIRAGFIPTPHEHLIVNFHKPISEGRKIELIEKIHKLGPF